IQPSGGAMNATVAKNLADYARGQGIDLGTFTDYNGVVIAGPFDFPLPAKTSSSIDPNTGYRYDTNVVDAVHVDPNTNTATKEADPLVLTQTSTQTDKVTKPDGSSTTQTKTTTTGQGTNVSNPNNAPTPDPETPFAGPAVTSVYTAKTKTVSDVLSKFQTSIKAAPWYAASVGFFAVTISGGSCPHWAVPASRWLPALDASQFVCSSTMLTLYAAGGLVVMIVAAWAAFRIAFL
ncbi:hypothetical protein AB4Z34_36510, partial [Ensifer sp. 2YAB10]|uniref:hypothetical protein n=1 Tax=Ensifer sp. 2YAB10 TaxID=3233021 RepID=UPI003F932366